MDDYVTNTTYAELAERIGAARRLAFVSHDRPDGDAVGSAFALSRALRARGQSVDILFVGPLEQFTPAIAEGTPYSTDVTAPSDDYDLIVVLDTGAWSQVEPLAAWLRKHHDRVIGFDHHARGDDVAALRIVDPAAASTTQVLVPLLDALGVKLTGEVGGVAEALFVGLATDTGWFRFANAGAAAFALSTRLLEAGVDKSRLYRLIEENDRPQRLALAARALASVRFVRDGAVAIMTLDEDDFRQTAAGVEDLTNLVNLPMSVGTVRVSILLTQQGPQRTKISFRSKPPISKEEAAALDGVVNVNALAQRFAGGGHHHAAGARVKLGLEEALAAVLELVGGP